MRKWIYGVGCPEGNEEIYLERFNCHYQEVFEYFKNRQDDLLVMDFSKGHGWEELCKFLGLEKPDVPFPHANKASNREKKSRSWNKKLGNSIWRTGRQIKNYFL
jgi:hypothetical protein